MFRRVMAVRVCAPRAVLGFVLRHFACVLGFIAAGLSPAFASSCPGNPNAIGTSRVIVVTPEEFPKVGGQQYAKNGVLPLAEREIVLTFDDGPLPPYTNSVLQTLAAECVKATFFMVGRQAAANPEVARQVYDAGHVVGTHSQNHPLTFNQMPADRSEMEFNDGLASVTAALGETRPVAPYFRIPGLLRVKPIEDYLESRRIAIWSVDFDADDWKEIPPEEIIKRALERIEAKRRGVLLLHDVQPATVLALPTLLQELKNRGYKIVQAIPAKNWGPKLPEPRKPQLTLPPISSSRYDRPTTTRQPARPYYPEPRRYRETYYYYR
jgi:peptidoglycan/xylan/chitin deacetylase (PgdA/CDA1 family)